MISPDGVSLRSVAVRGAGDLAEPPWPPSSRPTGSGCCPVSDTRRDRTGAGARARGRGFRAGRRPRQALRPPARLGAGRPRVRMRDAEPDARPGRRRRRAGALHHRREGRPVVGRGPACSRRGRPDCDPERERRPDRDDRGGRPRLVARRGVAGRPRPDGLVLIHPGSQAPLRTVAEGDTASSAWVAFAPDGREIAFAGGLGGARIAPSQAGRHGRSGPRPPARGLVAAATPRPPSAPSTVHVEPGTARPCRRRLRPAAARRPEREHRRVVGREQAALRHERHRHAGALAMAPRGAGRPVWGPLPRRSPSPAWNGAGTNWRTARAASRAAASSSPTLVAIGSPAWPGRRRAIRRATTARAGRLMGGGSPSPTPSRAA